MIDVNNYCIIAVLVFMSGVMLEHIEVTEADEQLVNCVF